MTMRDHCCVVHTQISSHFFSKISLLEISFLEPKYLFSNKDNKLIKYLQSTFIIEGRKRDKIDSDQNCSKIIDF